MCIQGPQPWKTEQGKSVYSFLSLIMSPLLLDVVWTHLTKVIWNIPPPFFFSYLFLKVCWLFFLFGIAVLARGSRQLGPVSLNSSSLFPPKKLWAQHAVGLIVKTRKCFLFSLQGTVDYKVAFSELLDLKIASSWKNYRERGLAGLDHLYKKQVAL